MSTGPPVWPAQDEKESQPPAETQTRARRSRRKKDDAAETDRKEPTKSARSRDKDKDKEKEKEKDKGKDQDKEKELKRPSRRPRDKSSSTSNNPTSTQSNPRKRPKLEATPAKQGPDAAPAVSAAASTASVSTPVPAHATTASVPTPRPSPPIAPATLTTNHSELPPQPQMPQSRHLDLTSQLIHPSQPAPPQAPTPTTSPPYPTMVSVPPSRPQSQPLAPPPQRSSGQNYDPIRSAFGTSSSPAAPPASTSTSFSPPARPVSPRPFRASASPAISSIIDPPQNNSPAQYAPRTYGSPSRPASSYPPTPVAPPAPSTHIPSSSAPYGHQSPYGPSPPALTSEETQVHAGVISSHITNPPAVPEPKPPAPETQQTTSVPVPVEDDSECPAPAAVEKVSKKEFKPSTAPSSKPPSPKPSRPAKEAPPPLPQGSGLISNALFGVDDSASDTPKQRTPNIIVHIPLKGHPNQIVNFARLAEEQYGFAALHPRLAAHKERMARVAAAGAALERNDRLGRGISAGESADEDLSFDAERDSEVDGDGAISAAAAKTNEPADGTKKRRRRKIEEYDRDDPFVDDSEMVWQEQAAASKDGFFVYSGPLVPEGDKIQVERADGTIKRGRGRGRGGRSRAPATTHQQLPLAAAIPISQETGLPIRGPGSRGGNINRRPRTSKKAEQDKAGGTPTSQGRGGGAAGRGGSNSTRGGKAPMVELAPRPNLAPAPPGLNSMAGPEIAM
ncbi:hypothetical protein BDV10DRAFT_161513, partial [Aspergillus recurvatus]